MGKILGSSRNAAMISASILMAAGILGAAKAATDSIYRYTTPQTGHYGIDNLAMIPDGANSLQYFNEFDVALAPLPGERGCFNTGINLPHGAIMTQLRVFYEGAAGADKPFVTLQRKRYTTGINNSVAEQDLPQSAVRTSANIPLNASFTTVNNAAFSYGFGICLRNENDIFYAARIIYTYQNAGD